MAKIYQKSFPVNKNAGFTLIELLVVVLIIGILAAVALPKYQVAVDKTKFMEMLTGCRKLAQAIDVYYLATGEYPKYWTDLDITLSGCQASTTHWSDLYCKNFSIDLNPTTFNAADVDFRVIRTGKLFNCVYTFETKKLVCTGADPRGKAVMRSMCGAVSCTL